MSVHLCADCNGKISSAAPACPHCGAPKEVALSGTSPTLASGASGRPSIRLYYRRDSAQAAATGGVLGLVSVATRGHEFPVIYVIFQTACFALAWPAARWLFKRPLAPQGEVGALPEAGTA